MHSVTNNSKAPQGVHTVSGVVFVRPGMTRPVELSETGLALASRLPFLTVEGGPVQDKPSEPVVPVAAVEPVSDIAKLRAEYLDLFDKRPFNGWDAAELQAKIDAKLAE